MKKLCTLISLALLVISGVVLLSCKRQSSGDQKSMMILDQDPRSAKDSAAIVTMQSPAFAKGVEHPPLYEPAPWLKADDQRPNAMEIDGTTVPPEKADFSKGVPIPVEPKEGSPPVRYKDSPPVKY